MGQGNGSRFPATAYYVQATPPMVVHIPPAPAYPPSSASVVSHGIMLSGASMAPSAYYYAPSLMEPIPPWGHGTYDYTDSRYVTPQCYFVQDSVESSGIDYHHLNAPVANNAFFVNNQVEGCNDIKEFFCTLSFLSLQSFSMSTSPSSSLSADLPPTVLLIPQTVQQHQHGRPLVALLDPGSNVTFLHRRSSPRGAVPTLLAGTTRVTAIAGDFTSRSEVWMTDITLPEFNCARRISQRALIFDYNCPSDVILGRDFLCHTGIDVKFSSHTIQREDFEVSMKPPSSWTIVTVFHTLVDNAELDPSLSCFASQHIMDSKYEEASPEAVAAQQSHLTCVQQRKLIKVLQSFPTLFNGKLEYYPHAKLHLELDPSKTPPKFYNAYSVPRLRLDTFKGNCYALLIMEFFFLSCWFLHCFPTFIIPNKDGHVSWVSDLCDLKRVLKRCAYPLPNIMEILTRRPSYSFFSKLDIFMQYYTFELQYAIIPKKDGHVSWVSDLCDLKRVLKHCAYPLPNIMEILTRRPSYSFFSKIDIFMQYYTFELQYAIWHVSLQPPCHGRSPQLCPRNYGSYLPRP